MVDGSLYLAFLVAAFALCVTPGPDMMFIVAVGSRGGPAVGVMAAAGVAGAMLVHTVAAALGLSALFETLPALYHVLRWLGAAYLLYLAVKAFRDRSAPGDSDGDGDGTESDPSAYGRAGAGLRRASWQGAVTNLLNPKVILFNVAFLPQFVDPSLGHVPGQLLLLGCTIVVMGFLWDGSIGLAAGRLTQVLRRSRRVARGLNIFTGTVFAGLAVRLAAAPE
ncbi:LysE family translocator [Streptomyces caniscabiei]|uniref:LysE family translocator n=1 Tax=Streptomyces caniscabiei TaxID=2746961 RepID=A0ABU4MYM4_9ACTN|nr:LysE family translocator [Streptomyces caniscabiei]MBE4741590.1 LysE family translocator [Streptomyces caniscabiei]MBE4761611.1 LysE family translocator [Streptomyces caniscabiei]MBE4775612.1 LysE family translocator [Streptomyces caniscabiei]MBE4790239.1 LysE family translocator [Streptomyces caniscabiei]MBE4799347.1 LysE family translocator [Streptomyces caniscabiei]